MTRISMFLTALSLAGPAVAGTWTENEADFDHLDIEDFQTQTPADWTYYDQLAPLVIGDLAYWGYVWPDTDWCIPSMDSAPPCGGTNIYLASAVDVTIEPQVPINQIGFAYGTQFDWWTATVVLDDGSVEQYDLLGTGGPFTPITGFLGYTADEGRTIVSYHHAAFDGGIDDIRVGVVGPGVCDSIDSAILDLGLQQGIENSLLAKVEAADRAEQNGQPDVAQNILSALLAEIDGLVGTHLTQEQADALLACVQARLDELP